MLKQSFRKASEKIPQIKLMIRYGMVGLLGTILHFSSLIVLVKFAGFDPVPASALGFILVLVVSFFLNKFWTFRSKNGGVKKFFRYTGVSLIGLALNTGVMFLTVHMLKWNYLVGQCLVIVVVPISNYLLNSLWTFNDSCP